MKIRCFIAAATFAFTVNNSAQAADIVRSYPPLAAPAAVKAPAFSWQGFYIGGEIGGSWARSKVRTWDMNGRYESWATKPDGFVGGLYAGYNFDAGSNIIIGIDTDILWTDVDGSDTQGMVKARVKQKWVGATRARIGYAAERWLPYIAGGVAYGRINGSVGLFDAGGVQIDGSDRTKTRAGWTLGTGVDYAMTDDVLLRLEYRYADFDKKTYHIAGKDTGGGYRIKYNANDFRFGVAYKF